MIASTVDHGAACYHVVMQLFENAFSPFARKVRLVLDHKQLPFEAIDGLDVSNRERLAEVNSRVEVPTLVDGELVVVGSADIVAYLEHRYPDAPVYPSDPAARVRARAWERCADTTIDPILVDISYWSWAERPDAMPDGLLAAARTDLDQIYNRLEDELASHPFVVGESPTIADYALFPHLSSTRALRVGFEQDTHPSLLGWYRRMRQLPNCAADLRRTKEYLARAIAGDGVNIERQRIFWRGDRIEWILARGYHEWFIREIDEGRVIWPGLGLP